MRTFFCAQSAHCTEWAELWIVFMNETKFMGTEECDKNHHTILLNTCFSLVKTHRSWYKWYYEHTCITFDSTIWKIASNIYMNYDSHIHRLYYTSHVILISSFVAAQYVITFGIGIRTNLCAFCAVEPSERAVTCVASGIVCANAAI